jgi:CRP-like cAMP-binding protein
MPEEAGTKLLDEFFASGKKMQFKRRQSVIQISDEPKFIYRIESGVISAFTYGESGNTVIHFLYKPGELFPVSQFYAPEKVVAGYSAFTDVSVYRKNFDEFLKYAKENSDVLWPIVRQQSIIYERIINLNIGPAKLRLVKWLMILCGRFGVNNGGHVDVNLPVTIQELADSIRLSRESTGKMLKELEKDGCVILGRQRLVVYPDKLRKT